MQPMRSLFINFLKRTYKNLIRFCIFFSPTHCAHAQVEARTLVTEQIPQLSHVHPHLELLFHLFAQLILNAAVI